MASIFWRESSPRKVRRSVLLFPQRVRTYVERERAFSGPPPPPSKNIRGRCLPSSLLLPRNFPPPSSSFLDVRTAWRKPKRPCRSRGASHRATTSSPSANYYGISDWQSSYTTSERENLCAKTVVPAQGKNIFTRLLLPTRATSSKGTSSSSTTTPSSSSGPIPSWSPP